jgi:hypothetical protein
MQVLSPWPRTGPLTFQQERLWFLHRLDPLSTAYNMPYTVRIEGRLRPDAVQAGLDAAVRSHGAAHYLQSLRAIGNDYLRHRCVRCRRIGSRRGHPQPRR